MTLSRSVKWIIAVVIALLVYWGIDVPTDLADPKNTALFSHYGRYSCRLGF